LGDSVLLYKHFENTKSWITLLINDLEKKIKIGPNNKIHFTIGDLSSSPHLVEAGIDNFKVQQTIQTSIFNLVKQKAFHIYPNPGKEEAILQFNENEQNRIGTFTIYNQNGQLQEQIKVEGQETIRLGKKVVPGLYLILWQNEKGYSQMEKWIKLE
jgi:hypothetical protein